MAHEPLGLPPSGVQQAEFGSKDEKFLSRTFQPGHIMSPEQLLQNRIHQHTAASLLGPGPGGGSSDKIQFAPANDSSSLKALQSPIFLVATKFDTSCSYDGVLCTATGDESQALCWSLVHGLLGSIPGEWACNGWHLELLTRSIHHAAQNDARMHIHHGKLCWPPWAVCCAPTHAKWRAYTAGAQWGSLSCPHAKMM
eukprot:1145268-Pelagomonas_calceolata.AAC.1